MVAPKPSDAPTTSAAPASRRPRHAWSFEVFTFPLPVLCPPLLLGRVMRTRANLVVDLAVHPRAAHQFLSGETLACCAVRQVHRAGAGRRSARSGPIQSFPDREISQVENVFAQRKLRGFLSVYWPEPSRTRGFVRPQGKRVPALAPRLLRGYRASAETLGGPGRGNEPGRGAPCGRGRIPWTAVPAAGHRPGADAPGRSLGQPQDGAVHPFTELPTGSRDRGCRAFGREPEIPSG